MSIAGEEAILRKLSDDVAMMTDIIAQEQAARKDLEVKVMKNMDEKCLALHVELAKEKKLREDPHGLLDADVKLSVDNMKLLVVQELPEHGYTGTITKDSFEEEVRGAASADDLAALLVKGLKREALLEIAKTGTVHEDRTPEVTLA